MAAKKEDERQAHRLPTSQPSPPLQPPLDNPVGGQEDEAGQPPNISNPNPNPNPIPDHLVDLLPLLFPDPIPNPNPLPDPREDIPQIPRNPNVEFSYQDLFLPSPRRPDPRFPFTPCTSPSKLKDDLVWEYQLFAGGPWVSPDSPVWSGQKGKGVEVEAPKASGDLLGVGVLDSEPFQTSGDDLSSPLDQEQVVANADASQPSREEQDASADPSQTSSAGSDPSNSSQPSGDGLDGGKQEVNAKSSQPSKEVLPAGVEDEVPQAVDAPFVKWKRWTSNEITRYEQAINRYGKGKWKEIAAFIGTRDNKQCKRRYRVYLKSHPDAK